MRVKDTDFIKVWQTGKSLKRVAEMLGMTTRAASARAGYYRGKGIPLKKFKRGPLGSEWQELRDLAKSLAPVGE